MRRRITLGDKGFQARKVGVVGQRMAHDPTETRLIDLAGSDAVADLGHARSVCRFVQGRPLRYLPRSFVGGLWIGHPQIGHPPIDHLAESDARDLTLEGDDDGPESTLSLIHISEPTRLRRISYAVFCL